MYILIRILLIVLIFLFCCFAYLKRKSRTIVQIVFKSIACLLFVSYIIMSFYPLESVILKFSSAEKVYNYATYGNEQKIVFAEGEKTGVYLYKRRNNKYSYVSYEKQSEKYKLINNSFKIINTTTNENGITVRLFKFKKYDDFYIQISGFTERDVLITDSENTEIVPYYEKLTQDSKIIHCLFVIKYNKDYCLYIDEQKIDLYTYDG